MSRLADWHYLWLKVIARAWSDDTFKRGLTGAADAGKYISENPGNIPLPASGVPLPFWLILKVSDNEPSGWLPQMGFWALPYTDVYVELMNRPTNDASITDQLAEYAKQMSFLGGNDPVRGEARDLRQQQETMLAASESPTIAFEQLVRWFTVWPHAVAHAWKEEGPTHVAQRPFRDLLKSNANLALFNAFGYEVPAGVQVHVNSIDAPYIPGRGPRVTLTMKFPTAPDIEERPVALAAYAESGRSFPFTLCAVT